MFRNSSDDIEEYTTSVTGFINKCIEDVVPTVTVCTYPNQKPWITGNICTELKGRAAAFKVWDSNPEAYKKSRYALRRTIKQAKRQYRAKFESYYTSSDARRMWQGLQTITDYKGKHSRELPSDTSLPDELNHFYTRFEASNTEACMRASAVLDDCGITLSVVDVSKTFKQVNILKAAGPDGLLGRVLRACADQLAGVFTDIFNMSLIESVIPTCFKQTTIVPVPKNTKATCLNDYRHVALTSIVMKCFERLVMAHINTIIPETLDPLQFAYRPNRSTDDAISIALHTALSLLDKRNTYVRMLFIDYSSALNAIVPSKLITKLRNLGLNTSLCNWILDFLTGRPQVVRVGSNTSATLILNTGAPQECELSPLLYSLFTHDCMARHDSNTTIKFADDTTVVGLITDNDETAYREEVRDLAGWCQNNNLPLNITKTKEMIVDYRKRSTEHVPILIDGAVVEQVESFKFLGVHINNKLEWSKHTKTVVKRARQSLFPLRKLKRFGMGPEILKRFYSCNIESILTSYITAWYGNCSASDRKALQRVVRTAQYITGAKLPAIQDLYTRRCQRQALKIVKDPSHPSHRLFSYYRMASGTRVPSLGQKVFSTVFNPKP
uniref:Reverse transcriptase domain-containing protein n=1 Tax=Salmo trutta TaxID=8032 RepID=A0A673ZE27_SALTR